MEEDMLIIEEGKSAHDITQASHDWLFSSTHPEPPEDVAAEERSNYSNFI